MAGIEYQYQVEVRVEIVKVDTNGFRSNDRLTFADTTNLGTLNFAQISDLLMRFHNLSQTATEELGAGAAAADEHDCQHGTTCVRSD